MNNLGKNFTMADIEEPVSADFEVVSYGRKLIAGYEIQLAGGEKVSLANIFGKLRAAITEELDYRCKK